ncbi:MAG: FHA domain-containing protein [Halioglobus sp.]
MQATLKPLSHPELGEIVIDDQLFPVGRSEPPFAGYDSEVVAHLSRRHARIFMEDGGLYVADLGSRNGTRLNDKPVEFRPVRLLPGDKLSFASQLDYEVAIRGQEEASATAAPDLSLTLQPVDDEAGQEPIVVSRFPFLVSKSDPAFSASAASDYLSRRHAHFFIRGGKLWLEDLGSTNGTFLNGERLDEHARPLADGDTVVFGGGQCGYRVQRASGATAGEAPADDDEECHTTFVTAADSFLDIFCVEEAEEAPAPEVEDSGESARSAAAAGPVQRPSRLSRLRTFFKELSGAFGDRAPGRARTRWIAVAVLAAVGALFAGIYYQGKTVRDIEGLLEAGDYRASAELASTYLASHPDDDTVRDLGTRALVTHAVNAWLPAMANQDFAAARAVIADARPLAAAGSTAVALLDLLAWNTDLHRFIAGRGGIDAPVAIYQQEAQIDALLDWWERNPREHRSEMGLLVNYVPDFRAMNALTFSHLRTLRNEKSVYLAAIEKLDATVRKRLESGQPESLLQEIDAVATQYPRLGGLDRLRDDLEQYLDVHAALQEDDRLRAAVALERAQFSTPPFIARAEQLRAGSLPSEDVTRRYREASAAWREGDLQQALALLEALSSEPGGQAAARDLQAKQQIIADYASLRQFRQAPDYGERLLRFYGGLDPVEDTHFIQALGEDLQRQSSAAREQADRAWETAASRWAAYRNGGGIRGVLRLEEEVSARFREQAGLLAAANDSARYGRHVYELLGIELSSGRAELYRAIEAETALQRRSLEQLSMVLSPAVLDAKLTMLAGSGEPARSGSRFN